MTTAIELAPHRNLRGTSRQATVDWHKAAGLLVTTVFPTVVWMCALALVAGLLGLTMSTPALLGVALATGAMCLLGASLVMTDTDAAT